MKWANEYMTSDGKDRLGEKLRQAGKAREDQWAAERDRELLAKLKRRSLAETHKQETPKDSTGLFANISCPIDFGEVSLAALDLAGRLAAQHGATLHVLHVARRASPGWRKTRQEITTTPEIDRLRELVAQRLDGVQGRCLVAIGEPADKIVDVARAVGADLVVIGTPARSTISRLLLGSVTERVLETSSCPVLVALYSDAVTTTSE
jgi:nucleotide-binding universal stress UspA family protein